MAAAVSPLASVAATASAGSPPPADAAGRMMEHVQAHVNRLRVMSSKAMGNTKLALQRELKSTLLHLENARTARASGDLKDLEKVCTMVLESQIEQLAKQIQRMREGNKNLVSVKVMDHVVAKELGPTIDREIEQAQAALRAVQEKRVSVDPADFTDHLDAIERALSGQKVTENGKVKVKNGYTTKRANFIENIVANVVTASMRLYLERVYRKMPKGEARWDEPLIPRRDGNGKVQMDAKGNELTQVNYSGMLKELGLYEGASAVYRLGLMGGDFNPVDRETAGALWMEILSGIVATGGTLLTAMLIRLKLAKTRFGKSRVANFAVRASAAALFGGLAGYISYAGIPAESRGADGSLWYATQRAAVNGVIRLGLPDGLIAVMDSLRGNAYGHIDEAISDTLVAAD